MKRQIIFLVTLLTLNNCTNKDEEYSVHVDLYPICIWVDAIRHQNDELTISVTARHPYEYHRLSYALNTFDIARSIFAVDENYNGTLIIGPEKIGTIDDFCSEKYCFAVDGSGTTIINDSFVTEYGEYAVEYTVMNAEHDPYTNGGIYIPTILFKCSSNGYEIHLPKDRISKK